MNFSLNKKRVLFCGVALTVAAIIGFGSRFIYGPDNPQIEEPTERFAENVLEDTLSLPDGTLAGQIDWTPGSKEKP